MDNLNIVAAWLGLLLGMVSGAVLGLGFARDQFLGGYASWPRRLCRLGHISFFGLAIVNAMFYFTVRLGSLDGSLLPWAGGALLLGAVSMPAVCFVSAFWKPARQAFAIPVLSLVTGVVLTLAVLLEVS